MLNLGVKLNGIVIHVVHQMDLGTYLQVQILPCTIQEDPENNFSINTLYSFYCDLIIQVLQFILCVTKRNEE